MEECLIFTDLLKVDLHVENIKIGHLQFHHKSLICDKLKARNNFLNIERSLNKEAMLNVDTIYECRRFSGHEMIY